jgi:hypothetical protein
MVTLRLLCACLALVFAAPAGAAWLPAPGDLRVTSLSADINDFAPIITLRGTINSTLRSAGYLVTVRAVFHLAQTCVPEGGGAATEVEADLGLGAYTLDLAQPNVGRPARQESWNAVVRASPNLLPGYTVICPAGSQPTTNYVRVTGALVVVYPGPLAPPQTTSGSRLLILFELLDGATRIRAPKGLSLCSCRLALARSTLHG